MPKENKLCATTLMIIGLFVLCLGIYVYEGTRDETYTFLDEDRGLLCGASTKGHSHSVSCVSVDPVK